MGFRNHQTESLVAQRLKRLPGMREAGVLSRGQEDPLEKENGTPLQYSCLENPTEGGAWQATVHGVLKSRTQLSNFTFYINNHKPILNLSELPFALKFPVHPPHLFNLFRLGSDPGSYVAFSCLFIFFFQKLSTPYPLFLINDCRTVQAYWLVEYLFHFGVALIVSLQCYLAGSFVHVFPVPWKSNQKT